MQHEITWEKSCEVFVYRERVVVSVVTRHKEVTATAVCVLLHGPMCIYQKVQTGQPFSLFFYKSDRQLLPGIPTK